MRNLKIPPFLCYPSKNQRLICTMDYYQYYFTFFVSSITCRFLIIKKWMIIDTYPWLLVAGRKLFDSLNEKLNVSCSQMDSSMFKHEGNFKVTPSPWNLLQQNLQGYQANRGSFNNTETHIL